MELSERKKQILELIINAYIDSAEPIGSRTISKQNILDLSPATIRNEMADLEEMGLLEQPHTSAGRIPSFTGYRIYVDTLMKKYRHSIKEIEDMKRAFDIKYNELDRIISYTAQLVSDFTNYTTIAIAPALNKSFIKKVEVVPVDEYSFLLVILASSGAVSNSLFKGQNKMSPSMLSMLRNFLNLIITNKPVGEITMENVLSLETAMGENKDLVMPMLRFATEAINDMDNSDIYLKGVQKMFNHKEYNDVTKIKEFLNMVEDKNAMSSIIEGIDPLNDTTVIIGGENKILKENNTSVVMCKYNSGGNDSGFIGIIGPTRMDYSKVISNLEYFTKSLNKLLDNTNENESE